MAGVLQGERRADRPIAGVLTNAAAFGAVSVSDALAKLSLTALPLPQVLTIRASLIILFIAPLVIAARMRGASLLATQQPVLHFLRGIAYVVSTVAFFFSVQHLDFTIIVSIQLATPIFATLSGMLLFGEQVRKWQWLAIGAGLAGCLVIVNPHGNAPLFWSLVAIASSIAWGLAQALLRPLSRTDDPLTPVFWGNTFLIVVVSVFALMDWREMKTADATLVLAMAIAQFASQWLSARAYRLAPVATVAPVQYTQIIWALLLGALLWGERPGPTTWIGVALIIVGGLFLIRREA